MSSIRVFSRQPLPKFFIKLQRMRIAGDACRLRFSTGSYHTFVLSALLRSQSPKTFGTKPWYLAEIIELSPPLQRLVRGFSRVAIQLRAHSTMASTDETTRGGKPVLASQRAKEEAEARGERPRSRFANVFPLSYKETFSQWVRKYALLKG